ncbi:hypothetical protein JCGZ_22281 [Jatropha curcas]|uniref:Uncharacterized protein n=1 Tax=Jatropha curcas TaxID=180498 RepID=A0A067JQS4_JATCU|nr:hypothetical protein JCGZ_22281 [Jatropha curcas]
MPPLLPSIPSFSTPFPGPVESSPASQSPTAPASSEPCNKLSLVAGHIYPSSQASRQIMRIIKLHLDKDGYTWDVWPGRNYALYGMLTSLIGCEKAVRSSSECLRRYVRAGRRLGRILYSRESVFTYTHTKDHDRNMFIDRHALGINENYSTPLERVVSSQVGSEAESRTDELALYLEAVGGKKKRKVYGIGSQASQFYCDLASDTFVVSSRLQPDHSAKEISALRARVDKQERQLAEHRANVMRMSDHHGSGTSSSTPQLAIDPHIFIALHQPISSPLDPDTVDDALVTPANTTTHPAADTTINPVDTTLDRPDNRYHRFDFGPF